MVATALVVFLYALTPGLKWERGTLHVSGYVRRHLTVLACLFLALLAAAKRDVLEQMFQVSRSVRRPRSVW